MDTVEQLRALNAQYISAAVNGDVAWYDRYLADDFVCIDSDATVRDKPAFLRMTAEGSDLEDYSLIDVDVRVFGVVGLVRATGTWTATDGRRGISRYTDVYALGDDGWKVVSAQITRPAKRTERAGTMDVADRAR
jgi:ketosteroid isomerase-like protein